MKQSAVEWLIDQMLKQGYFDGNKPLTYTNLDHLQQQAKEMEKKQQGYSEEDMLKSFMAGIKCESNHGKNFEQFIKQFKNK